MDETPANICGGKVREIGGRDQVFVRGAGVESVLHTVRIAVITQAGASVMIVELDSPLGRPGVHFRADLEGEARWFATLTLLFKGVDLDGVFCRPRGVGAAFEGVFPIPENLVGVVGAEPVRDGVPETEPLAERLTPAELEVRDRSKNE